MLKHPPHNSVEIVKYAGHLWAVDSFTRFFYFIKFQGLELHAMCFVFKSAVVFLCKERLRQKKKTLMVSLCKSPGPIYLPSTFCGGGADLEIFPLPFLIIDLVHICSSSDHSDTAEQLFSRKVLTR